jgi:hypothetical protein
MQPSAHACSCGPNCGCPQPCGCAGTAPSTAA